MKQLMSFVEIIVLAAIGCSGGKEIAAKAQAEAEAAKAAQAKAEAALCTLKNAVETHLRLDLDDDQLEKQLANLHGLVELGRTNSQPLAPFCLLAARPMESNFGGGTKLVVWRLRLHGIKEVRARLQIASDGKLQPGGDEIICTLNEWNESDAVVTGQLSYLRQNIGGFDKDSNRIGSLALDVFGHGHAKTTQPCFVEIDKTLKPNMQSTIHKKEPQSATTLVYADWYLSTDLQPGESIPFHESHDSLVAWSKGGKTVVAITLETK